MSHFIQLDLPPIDLLNSMEVLLQDKKIHWHRDQICITGVEGHSDDYTMGVGSLHYDWDRATRVEQSNGDVTTEVPFRDIIRQEADFNVVCNPFVGTPFETVVDIIKARYHAVGRIRLMRMQPNKCLSWHTDSGRRIHIPIVTDEGAKLVVGDEAKHLPANTWWDIDTTVSHTAFNATSSSRIHLVACLL